MKKLFHFLHNLSKNVNYEKKILQINFDIIIVLHVAPKGQKQNKKTKHIQKKQIQNIERAFELAA